MTIHSDSPAGDLSRLRIDRDAGPRRRWLPWAILLVLGAAAAAVYPNARAYVAERRAPVSAVAIRLQQGLLNDAGTIQSQNRKAGASSDGDIEKIIGTESYSADLIAEGRGEGQRSDDSAGSIVLGNGARGIV